jgi:sarcosine oxidase subunit gamma
VHSDRALVAGWRHGLAIVNLRGDADDPAFRAGVASVVGPALPVQPCTSAASDTHRLVWAGPDDWFVIAPRGEAALETAARSARRHAPRRHGRQ